jgi:hypothetical protein
MPPRTRSRAAFQTALDIAVAPSAAFARLRETPTWVWAFALSALLAIVGSIATSPAFTHALAAETAARLAAAPQIAQLPPDQRDAAVAQQLALIQTVARFGFVFIPFGLALSSGVQALIMLIANAIGKGDGTFRKFWALAVNASLIGTGLASLALAAIVLLRGYAEFTSTSDLSRALPGPVSVIPATAVRLSAFLSVMNVFAIWDVVLLAAGMTAVARLPRPLAAATAAVILIGAGLIALAGTLGGR